MTTAADPNQKVAEAAIATQQPVVEPGAGLNPGEVVPEVLVNATPAVNAFANDDEKLEAMLAEQKLLDEAKAAADAKAKAEAEAGITTAAPAAAATTAAAGTTAAQPAKTGHENAAAASGKTVESAVIALRRANTDLKTKLAVEQGKNQVLESLVKPGGAAAPAGTAAAEPAAQPTFEESFQAIDADYAAIATKVDNGELSMTDAEKERQAIRVRERQLNDERAQLIATETTAQHSAPVNDLGLTEHMTQLVVDYPVLKTLTKDELLPIEDMVYRNAEKAGNPIPEGPLGTKRLREAMAELAERNYDPKATEHAAARAARKQPGAAPGPGGQPQPSAGAKPGATTAQPTAQQREAKLVAAGNMPPNIQDVGAGATGGEITDAQGAAILGGLKNEDEIIRWLDANPRFRDKQLAGVLRPPR